MPPLKTNLSNVNYSKEPPSVLADQRQMIEDLAKSNEDRKREFNQVRLALEATHLESKPATEDPQPRSTTHFVSLLKEPDQERGQKRRRPNMSDTSIRPHLSTSSPPAFTQQCDLDRLLEEYTTLRTNLISEVYSSQYNIEHESRKTFEGHIASAYTSEKLTAWRRYQPNFPDQMRIHKIPTDSLSTENKLEDLASDSVCYGEELRSLPHEIPIKPSLARNSPRLKQGSSSSPVSYYHHYVPQNAQIKEYPRTPLLASQMQQRGNILNSNTAAMPMLNRPLDSTSQESYAKSIEFASRGSLCVPLNLTEDKLNLKPQLQAAVQRQNIAQQQMASQKCQQQITPDPRWFSPISQQPMASQHPTVSQQQMDIAPMNIVPEQPVTDSTSSEADIDALKPPEGGIFIYPNCHTAVLMIAIGRRGRRQTTYNKYASTTYETNRERSAPKRMHQIKYSPSPGERPPSPILYPCGGSYTPTSSQGHSSTSSIPNRDYIPTLVNLSSPPTTGTEKRVQKHPATFPCHLCPKKFTRAYNLRSHLRSHTDHRLPVSTDTSHQPLYAISKERYPIQTLPNSSTTISSSPNISTIPTPEQSMWLGDKSGWESSDFSSEVPEDRIVDSLLAAWTNVGSNGVSQLA